MIKNTSIFVEPTTFYWKPSFEQCKNGTVCSYVINWLGFTLHIGCNNSG